MMLKRKFKKFNPKIREECAVFGIAKSYTLIVCLFTAIDVVYDSKKWPLNLKDSLTFPLVEKGSIYLIKVFPNQKQYEDAKEKVQDV